MSAEPQEQHKKHKKHKETQHSCRVSLGFPAWRRLLFGFLGSALLGVPLSSGRCTAFVFIQCYCVGRCGASAVTFVVVIRVRAILFARVFIRMRL